MKVNACFIFLMLWFVGCKIDKTHTNSDNQCNIVFTNVDSTANLTMVVFAAPNFERFQPTKYANGNALFQIPGMKQGIVSVQSPAVSGEVFVTEGDTISLTVLNVENDKSFEFHGLNAAHYNFLSACDKVALKYQNFSGDIELYKMDCKRRFESRKDFLKEYALANTVSLEFLDHINKMFEYDYFYELTIPLSTITVEELNAADPNYFSDIPMEELFNDSILTSRTGTLALNHYFGRYLSRSYQDFEGEEFKKNSLAISERLNGRLREYAYTELKLTYFQNLLPDNINLLKDNSNITKEIVQDSKFFEQLDKIDKKLMVLNKPLPDSIKNIRLMGLDDKMSSLGAILEKYKSSKIVIDNWASWCWACFMDMEDSKDFKDQLVKEGIKWVYISIDQGKDVDKWRQKSKEMEQFGLLENQYLVIDEDLKMYNDFFETYEGIPLYLFFNRFSEFALSPGPRPTDTVTFRKALDQIEINKIILD